MFLLLEMTVRECVSRAGFEIPFKRVGLLIVCELNSNDSFPWFVFRSVFAFPLIVSLEAIVKIIGDTYISFARGTNTF